MSKDFKSRADAWYSTAIHLKGQSVSKELAHEILRGKKGLLAALFPTEAERREFLKTETYDEIRSWLDADDDAGTKFLLRLPVSMMEMLKRESEREQVSMNTLMIAKLGVSLSELSKKVSNER